MISPGEKVIAALSGGVDSMVMLHLLVRFQKEAGGSLLVAHLNHGLRGEESLRDENFVRKSAADLGLDCHCSQVNLKGVSENLQEAGRHERYAFFNALAKDVKGDKIALGHNADDQAETVLMRLIRGSGIGGMGGIPPVRQNIIRPLLCLSRKEIEDYALKEGISFIQDSSNLDKKYLRNSIRLDLMPLLRSYNPNISRELNMLSNISRDIDSYLDDKAAKCFKKAKIHEKTDEETIFLDLAEFNLLPSALKGKMITIAFEKLTGSASGLYSSHIVRIEELAERGKSGTAFDLPKQVKAFIEYEKLGFSIAGEEDISFFSTALNLDGETFIPQLGITFESKRVKKIDKAEREDKNIIHLDMEKIKVPLVVRNFKNGDRIKIKGMEGRKKLKNLYIDEKVPARMRKKIPLITADHEILWVVGLRHNGNAVADCQSKDILRISKN